MPSDHSLHVPFFLRRCALPSSCPQKIPDTVDVSVIPEQENSGYHSKELYRSFQKISTLLFPTIFQTALFRYPVETGCFPENKWHTVFARTWKNASSIPSFLNSSVLPVFRFNRFFLAFSLICMLAATQKISNKKRRRSDLRSSLFFKISPFFFYSIHTESLICICAPVYLSAFFHKLLQKNTAGIHDENKKTVCVFSDRTFPSDAFFPGNRCHRCRKRTATLV